MKIIKKFFITTIIVWVTIPITPTYTMSLPQSKKPLLSSLEQEEKEQIEANLQLLNAVQQNNRRALQKAILTYHADLEAVTQYGDTALHIATTNEHHPIMRTLLNNKANVNKPDMYGFVPLALAVINNDSMATRMLMLFGADPLTPNTYGTTPFDLASLPIRTIILKTGKL